MRRLLLRCILFLILSGTAFAGTVQFDVNPKIIQLGEAGSCTVVVTGISSPQEPHLKHGAFQIESAGTGTNVQIINGEYSRSQTFNFRFVPLKTGNYTIGPYDYEVKRGKVVKLPPIQIKVVSPSKTAGESEGADLSEFLFAKFTSGRDVVYEQETVELTLSIYSKGITLGSQIKLLDLKTDGLSLGEFGDVVEGREMVDGELYNVKRFTVKAHVTGSGKVSAAPILSIPVVTRSQRNRFGDSFFDDAFRSTNRVKVFADPLEVQSTKIPLKGRPANYSGAVGLFDMNVSLTPTELTAGEPVNVTIDIKGKGNINIVTAPEILYGEQFKYYDANLVENLSDNDGFVGRKTFEQVVIPKSDAVTEFPEIRFSYFDTRLGEYKTITQGPFPLIVKKGTVAEIKRSTPLENTPKTEEKQIVGGEDIVYLKAAPSVWSKGDFQLFSTKRVLIGYVVPFVIIIWLIGWGVRNRYFHQDVVKQRRKMALKRAAKQLKAADVSNPEIYYASISQVVCGYFADYYNLSLGESIPFERIDSDVTVVLKNILQQCEYARFAGKAVEVENSSKWNSEILDLFKQHEKLNSGQV